MKYPLTFHWAKGVGKGSAASARMCFIFIKPEYKGDEGLYQHELMHVKQWATVSIISGLIIAAVYAPFAPIAVGVHGLLYIATPKYRLWCEAQAYAKQLNYYEDDRTERFANYITKYYNVKESNEVVIALLNKLK